MKIQLDQVSALVVFIVCALLLWLKIDGEVKSAMTLAVGFMFGSGYQARKKGGGK